MPKEEGDKFVLFRTSCQCLRALLSCKPQQGKKVGGEISGSFFLELPYFFSSRRVIYIGVNYSLEIIVYQSNLTQKYNFTNPITSI